MKFFRNVPDIFRSDNIREKNFSVTYSRKCKLLQFSTVIHFYISYNLPVKIMIAFASKDIYYSNLEYIWLHANTQKIYWFYFYVIWNDIKKFYQSLFAFKIRVS